MFRFTTQKLHHQGGYYATLLAVFSSVLDNDLLQLVPVSSRPHKNELLTGEGGMFLMVSVPVCGRLSAQKLKNY